MIAKMKWLYLARLFSLTGSQILFFVVPLLIFKLTQSAFYTGMAFSFEWTARIISFPLSGLLADRFGARKVYVISDMLIAFLILISIIITSIYHQLIIPFLVILSVLAGFLAEQGYVSAESLAPKLVDQSYYAKSQSILELLEQFALLFGPTIAGVFIFYFHASSLLIISLALYVLSALAMCGVQVTDRFISKHSSIKSDFLTGFSIILKNDYLKNIIVLSILMNFTFGLMTGSAPIMVLGIYDMGDKYYALLNLSAGIAGVMVTYLLNVLIKKHSIVSIGVGAYILACILCILIGYSHSYSSYLFLFALFYAVSGAFSVFFRSERARVIPHSVLGRTIGAIIFITFVLFPLAGLMISASHKYLSLGHLISYTGIVFLAFGVILLSQTHKKSRIVYVDG